MKVTYCQDWPKKFLCERDEHQMPTEGGYIELQGGRYLVRRIERIAQEALAFVSPD
ncbi:MAG: hypothetical protein PGN12_01935 [Sphingomonas phyllosphaerae]